MKTFSEAAKNLWLFVKNRQNFFITWSTDLTDFRCVKKVNLIIHAKGQTPLEIEFPKQNFATFVGMLGQSLFSSNKIVIGWDLKQLFSYLKFNLPDHVPLPVYCELIDIKLCEAFLGIIRDCPYSYEEAAKRLGLILSNPAVCKVSQQIYRPLIAQVIPGIETFGLVNKELELRQHPLYLVEGQANGRLNTKVYDEGFFNPHNLTLEEKSKFSAGHEKKFLAMDYRSMEVCLAGEMLVETIDGSKTIKDIVTCIDNNEEVWVYGFDVNENRIAVSKVSNGKCVKKSAEVWKLTLDNGESVIATPEHKIMLRDGSYLPLSSLKPGMSLMPFYKEDKKSPWGTCYEKIYLNNGSSMLAHNLIALDVFDTKIAGSGLVIHHKDGNGVHNSLNNLEVLTRSEHIKKSWKSNKKNKRNESLRRMSESKIKNEEKCLICEKYFGLITYKHLVKHNLTVKDYRDKYNHKVVSVELFGNADVYDITVDNINNFALHSGIIVHNCVLEWLTKDEVLGDIIKSGRDIYAAIYEHLLNRKCDSKGKRQWVKSIFLPIVYGSGINRVAELADVSVKVATGLINTINKKFSTAMNWVQAQQDQLKQSEVVQDCFGRKLDFSKGSGRGPWSIRNAVVQSPAALINLERSIKLYQQRYPSMDVVALIHDAYICTVNASSWESAASYTKELLESPSQFAPECILKVDVSVGEDWGNLTKVKYE